MLTQLFDHWAARLNLDHVRAYAQARVDTAVDDGFLARSQPDGSFLVRSSTADFSHVVTAWPVDGLWWLTCDCESGQYRPAYPVPCRHAARVGLSLAGWRGRADEVDGLFWEDAA